MSEQRRRKHKSLFVKIAVYECENEKQIRDLKVDLSNGEKMQWLFDLVLWATLNGKAVEICNERDY